MYPIHLSKSILQTSAAKSIKVKLISFRLEIDGGERARTDDLLRAKQVLSQLSYTPKKRISDFGIRTIIVIAASQRP